MELKPQSSSAPAPTHEASNAPAHESSAAPSFELAPEHGEAAPHEGAAPASPSTPDPFAHNEWNFELNPGSSSPQAGSTPEAPAPSSADVSAPTQIIEPQTSAPVAPAPAAPSTPMTGTAKLLLKRGGAPTGDVFSIGPNATVGRFDPESGPVDVDMANLPEAVYISRHHAEVALRDGQWIVKDLGSRNGTFVKSASGFTRVTGETPIQNGDEVAFGNARFEFQTS